MKPMTGAAWDITPEHIEQVNEPGSEGSQSFEPGCHHPDHWPGQVMGFDYTGGALPHPKTNEDYSPTSPGLPINPQDKGVPVTHV